MNLILARGLPTGTLLPNARIAVQFESAVQWHTGLAAFECFVAANQHSIRIQQIFDGCAFCQELWVGKDLVPDDHVARLILRDLAASTGTVWVSLCHGRADNCLAACYQH